MSIELDNIRTKDLIQGSYDDVLNIIEALEKVNPFHYSGISAIEKMETYRSYAYILKERISNNEFRELIGNDRRREKNALVTKLSVIIESFSSSLRINGILAEQEMQITQTIKKATEGFLSEKDNIEKLIEKTEADLDDSEHRILAHVLSLMGIFSAIITLIMSMVITSSSWLNNADGASAIIAFVIPNLIALISVFTLLSLIFFYLHRDTSAKNEPCSKHKKSVAFTIVIAALLVCVILCCWFCLSSK